MQKLFGFCSQELPKIGLCHLDDAGGELIVAGFLQNRNFFLGQIQRFQKVVLQGNSQKVFGGQEAAHRKRDAEQIPCKITKDYGK